MFTLNPNQKVCIPEHILAQDLQEEAALLNIQTQQYYGLDDVGSQMWKALTEKGSIQEAYDALLTFYEVDAEKLKQDLSQLIDQLQSHGLIQLIALEGEAS